MGYRKRAEPQDLLIELLAMLGPDATLRFLSRTIHIFIATFLAEIPRQTSRKHPTATQKPPRTVGPEKKRGPWAKRVDHQFGEREQIDVVAELPSPSCRHRFWRHAAGDQRFMPNLLCRPTLPTHLSLGFLCDPFSRGRGPAYDLLQ